MIDFYLNRKYQEISSGFFVKIQKIAKLALLKCFIRGYYTNMDKTNSLIGLVIILICKIITLSLVN